MPNDVRCTVSDCKFWDEGNLCAAEFIWVTHERLASAVDMEVSDLESVQTMAKRSVDTCCRTYEPRQGK